MTRTHLFPAPRYGLRAPEARSWRIGVEGGALVERRPDAPARVVAEPGRLARVVLLRDAQVPRSLRSGLWCTALVGPGVPEREAVAFLGDDAVLLVVGVSTFTPLAVGFGEDAGRRESGLLDVVAALGLPLERAEDDEVQRVAAHASAVTRGPVADQLARHLVAHVSMLLIALAAVVALFAAPSYSRAGALVPASIALAALLGLSLDQWRLGSAFLRAVGAPAPPTLQVTGQHVSMSTGGTSTWIPGPEAGGAVQCQATDSTLGFVDRRDTLLLLLTPARTWRPDGDDAAVADACREAGIVHRRTERAAGVDAGLAAFDAALPRSLRAAASMGASSRPREGSSGVDNGDGVIFGPFLTALGLALVATLMLGPDRDRGVAEITIAALAAAGLLLCWARTWRLRRWDVAARAASAQPAVVRGPAAA